MSDHYGMDGEPIWPHWDCPDCDAPNAGVEQCNPARGVPVLCDECGAEMVYQHEQEQETEMTSNVVWWAVYETKGDADWEWFDTQEEAIAEAKSYLSFAGGVRDCVYVVPYDLAKAEADEEWHLFDHIHDIPADQWVWIHGDRREYTGANNDPPSDSPSAWFGDIVAELRNLADGEDDSLGSLLERAACEIERLRKGAKR